MAITTFIPVKAVWAAFIHRRREPRKRWKMIMILVHHARAAPVRIPVWWEVSWVSEWWVREWRPVKCWIWWSVQWLRIEPLIWSMCGTTSFQVVAWPLSSLVIWLILIPVRPGLLSTASLEAISFWRSVHGVRVWVRHMSAGERFARYGWLNTVFVLFLWFTNISGNLPELFVKLAQCVLNVGLGRRKGWPNKGSAGESYLL